MPTPAKSPPSFSAGRRWKIGFDVVVRTALVLAVAVMLNYLGAQFSHRFYLSSQTRVALSPRTLSVLRSVTNHVSVTVYYDKDEELYPLIIALLGEYHLANPNLTVRTVDYVRDVGEAGKVKEQYKLGSLQDKDLVIFDCAGHFKTVNGNALAQYAPAGTSKDGKIEFRPAAFMGEMMFTSQLIAVLNPKPFKAYFLQGHGEPSLSDSGERGYLKFGAILGADYIATEPLQLLGDRAVPDDCNLLIIAGPAAAFSEVELQKIDQYLAQGGRLFALFDYYSSKRPTGLESILSSRWGVNVGFDSVQDAQATPSRNGQDMVVSSFSQHPVVNPLVGSGLYLVLPRPVSAVKWQQPPADAPQVGELAFSGATSTLAGDPAAAPRSYPLAVAVEQKPAAGIANARGTTRMVVVGDSLGFGNTSIESLDNRDFITYAVNWLLDRPALLQGIGPRKVTEFRLNLTQAQQRDVRWLLLGALPGAVLLFGWLVWLVRRK